MFILLALQSKHLCTKKIFHKKQYQSLVEGLTIVSLFNFTPLTVTCCGFSLVTNVRIVGHFGQKHLLNVHNVNVNYMVDLTVIMEKVVLS